MQINRTRGDTYPDVFTVTNTSTKALVNLTGCTFLMTLNSVRNPVDSATQVYQVTGVVTDPATGEVYFSPTEEQADQAGFFYYDVQMTDSYGAITTLMKDVYFYSESITK